MSESTKEEIRQFYAGIRVGIELYSGCNQEGIRFVGSGPYSRSLEDAIRMIDILERGALGEPKKEEKNETSNS